MAPKKRRTGGRTTPAGGRTTPAGTPPATTRYTPPVPVTVKESPRWVPILMFVLLGLGGLVILFYYLGFVPGGRTIGTCSPVFRWCSAGCSQRRSIADQHHLLHAMPRRRRILVGREREFEFDSADTAAIAHVDAAHLAARRRRKRARHAAQHAETHLPDEPYERESDRHPDERAEHGARL